MKGALEIQLAGEVLRLLPGRAVLRPKTGELLVADVHLGKEDAFRRVGRGIPDGATADDLRRLGELLRGSGARRLTVLGDLTHHVLDEDAPNLEALGRWLREHADWQPTLVSGNHDRHAAARVEALGLHVVDEPHAVDGIDYRHAPPGAGETDSPWLAGHVHPGLVLGTRTDRLRVPVFHLRDGRGLVLPAFGGFTGLQIVAPGRGDRCFAVGSYVVVETATFTTRARHGL